MLLNELHDAFSKVYMSAHLQCIRSRIVHADT